MKGPVDDIEDDAYNEGMATLNIRNLPDDVHRSLRLRAARAGRSMEAEAREILARECRAERGLVAPASLQAFVDELYGAERPEDVVGSLIADRRREALQE